MSVKFHSKIESNLVKGLLYLSISSARGPNSFERLDLSLLSVVRPMPGSDKSWAVMVSYCETVMSQESGEKEREENLGAAPLRRSRTGRRWTRYDDLLRSP